MPNLMFQDQFAPKVEAGTKRRTIRPRRKRPIRVGQKLFLRQWLGAAYRSKTRLLREERCMKTSPIQIWKTKFNRMVQVNKHCLFKEEVELFARLDGFDDFDSFFEFFETRYCLPFQGDLIEW